MTVLLEYIDHSPQILHKCLMVLNTLILHFPIMMALYLMFSMTHYAQNYAGIIGGSLPEDTFNVFCVVYLHTHCSL